VKGPSVTITRLKTSCLYLDTIATFPVTAAPTTT
jgi:hypothetical protein